MRFHLVDRVTLWRPGREAEGRKNVALCEPFFGDHFPLRPVMPGMLMLEGMQQLSAALVEEGWAGRGSPMARLAFIEDLKFREMVRPGDTLTYRVEVIESDACAARVSGRAMLGEQTAASCRMEFRLEGEAPAERRAKREAMLRTWGVEAAR